MRLYSFNVENYRSIRKAQKLELANLTILVGPNNEGKSNIVRAMVLGMRILRRASAGLRLKRIGTPLRDHAEYLYARDCPTDLQASRAKTTLEFEFEFSREELTEFASEIGVNLQTRLKIALVFDSRGIDLRVRKQGSAGAILTQKSDLVAKFIAGRLKLEYVPAVRTAQEALRAVENILEGELSTLEESVEYQHAVNEIQRLQQPVLDRVARNVEASLKGFLPDVQAVSIAIPGEARRSALRRNCEFIVDDGNPTDISLKGDGVQSLAALSLIHYIARESSSSGDLILAIEEPEAHLHPRAIHQLRQVFQDIAASQQVIITTHSPILVERSKTTSNIVVETNRARVAKDLQDLRKVLGVRTSDNLVSAELVLIVEGFSDYRIFSAVLSSMGATLERAIKDGVLAIEHLGGGTNLSYRLSEARSSLSGNVVFLDNDDTGRDAIEKARSESLLLPTDSFLASVHGRRNSELEDLLDQSLYAEMIKDTYGVNIHDRIFRRTSKKWSDRLAELFQAHGRPWSKSIEVGVKEKVSELAEANPVSAFHSGRILPVKNLAEYLERRLGELS